MEKRLKGGYTRGKPRWEDELRKNETSLGLGESSCKLQQRKALRKLLRSPERGEEAVPGKGCLRDLKKSPEPEASGT